MKALGIVELSRRKRLLVRIESGESLKWERKLQETKKLKRTILQYANPVLYVHDGLPLPLHGLVIQYC